VVCCVVVGCATVVVSCVVVVVVGSSAHAAKPSITATPSTRIIVFIVEFPFVENSAQVPQTDVFLANFFRVMLLELPVPARSRRKFHRSFPLARAPVPRC
jgi:hypothetical protein